MDDSHLINITMLNKTKLNCLGLGRVGPLVVGSDFVLWVNYEQFVFVDTIKCLQSFHTGHEHPIQNWDRS
jgi:hypothetical protein